MSVKLPFTAVEVRRAASGFYEGHSVEIALLSKGIMVALVIWALVWPSNAKYQFRQLERFTFGKFQRIQYHHCRAICLFSGCGRCFAANGQAKDEPGG